MSTEEFFAELLILMAKYILLAIPTALISGTISYYFIKRAIKDAKKELLEEEEQRQKQIREDMIK